MGAYNKGAVDYPDFAHEVARLVSIGKAWRGIMIDGAGIGSCIVANKVPGIRAGMAYDYSSAVNSREHNDTNVLTLGAGLIGVNLAQTDRQSLADDGIRRRAACRARRQDHGGREAVFEIEAQSMLQI